MWDAARGQVVATLRGHALRVCGLTFSPDGSLLATGSGDGTVRLWNARSGEPTATFTAETGLSLLSFAPDGKVKREPAT